MVRKYLVVSENLRLSGKDYENFWDACGGGIDRGIDIDIPLVKHYLTMDIDVNKADHTGDTPLMMAANYGNFELVKLLVKNKGFDLKKSRIEAALKLSAKSSDVVNHYLRNVIIDNEYKAY